MHHTLAAVVACDGNGDGDRWSGSRWQKRGDRVRNTLLLRDLWKRAGSGILGHQAGIISATLRYLLNRFLIMSISFSPLSVICWLAVLLVRGRCSWPWEKAGMGSAIIGQYCIYRAQGSLRQQINSFVDKLTGLKGIFSSFLSSSLSFLFLTTPFVLRKRQGE